MNYKTFINLINASFITYWAKRSVAKDPDRPDFEESGGEYFGGENSIQGLVEQINTVFASMDTLDPNGNPDIKRAREKMRESTEIQENIDNTVKRVVSMIRDGDSNKLANFLQSMRGSTYAMTARNKSTRAAMKRLNFTLKSGTDYKNGRMFFVFVPVDHRRVLESDDLLNKYIHRNGFMNCVLPDKRQNDQHIVYDDNGFSTVEDINTVVVYGSKSQLELLQSFLNYGEDAVIDLSNKAQKDQNGGCQYHLTISPDRASEFIANMKQPNATWQRVIHFLDASIDSETAMSQMGDQEEDPDKHGSNEGRRDAAINDGINMIQMSQGDDTQKLIQFNKVSVALVDKMENALARTGVPLRNRYVAFDPANVFASLMAEVNRMSEYLWNIDNSFEFIRVGMETGGHKQADLWEVAGSKAYFIKPGTTVADKSITPLIRMERDSLRLLEALKYEMYKDTNPQSLSEFPVISQKAHAEDDSEKVPVEPEANNQSSDVFDDAGLSDQFQEFSGNKQTLADKTMISALKTAHDIGTRNNGTIGLIDDTDENDDDDF